MFFLLDRMRSDDSLLTNDDQAVARGRVPNRISGGVWPSRRDKSRGATPARGVGAAHLLVVATEEARQSTQRRLNGGGFPPKGGKGFPRQKYRTFPLWSWACR